jgi:hypothetical protein
MRYALIVAFLVAYTIAALRTPYGAWDAWAIWNSKARLFLYHDPLLVLQISALPHKDYPPLLSLVVMYGYRVFGDVLTVPIVVHGAVYAGLLWLMRARLWPLALVGAVALVYAPTQYADLPLAVCFLGAAVAYRHDKPLWVGFALGCGMLIKNEGALIAVAFYAVWIVSTRHIHWKALAVTLPFAVCLLLYRQVANETNDVIGAGGILDRLTDLTRYPIMIPLLIGGVLTFGGGAFAVLGAALWIERKPITVSVPLLAAVVVGLGYVAIYAITPHDVAWHVLSSWDRLLLHVFPVIVYELTTSNALKRARS